MKRKFALLSLIIIALCSCRDSQPQVTVFTGHAMTIDYSVTIGAALTARDTARAQQIIYSAFDEVNTVFNQWNPQSEVSALNNLPANTHVRPSTPLYRLLQYVDVVVQSTHGRYDPTVEPLTKLWISKLKEGQEPSSSEIQQLAHSIGWAKVHLQDGEFWKTDANVRINLDSISKGLCVDIITERLDAAGYHHLLVDWGGEIRAIGQHPEGRPWRIYIRRLLSTNPDDAIAYIDLNHAAVATSGDYLQQWTVTREGDTRTYSHILNTTTLQPFQVSATSMASATVMAPTCAIADALATASMCFADVSSAKEWAEAAQELFPQTIFWLVSRQ